MSEISRRELARRAYIRLISAGTQISPKEFARRSPAFLGEQVPYETVRTWYKEDDWPRAVILSEFGASTELVRTREFMTSSVEVIVNEDGRYTSQDLASAASEYRKMVAKLPEVFYYVIEEEIVQVRDKLYDSCQILRAGRASYRIIARLSGVWADLAKFVVGDVQRVADNATIFADEIILRSRMKTATI